MAARKDGPVTADMMVGDVLRDYPALREKVKELFGETCLQCKSNQKESITYTSWHKGLDPAKVVRELNGALKAK
jgi:hypothetical protein